MTRKILIHIAFLLAIMASMTSPISAREGDTLDPITIDAPTLETSPENLLNDNDVRALNQRINEARTSGVPLAVRIIDTSQPAMDIPFSVRQHIRDDVSLPLTTEQMQEIAQSWANSEAIESSEGANDGILLLVLVPEDRTQTQAAWWLGPNALPINGLTKENILATHGVMDAQFANGNMPNGVFVGLLEFSYNIQFGTPERLERSKLQNALHIATIPMAVGTALAGVAIPVLAVWLSRRTDDSTASETDISPWEAAALHLGRARAEIPAAMLLDAVHRDEITPLKGGGVRLATGSSSPAIDALRPFADDGTISAVSMYEIEAITHPVREQIEGSLVDRGAMTTGIQADRTRMLIAMGIAAFLVALTAVPSVKSLSTIGILGMVIGVIGIGAGWWWLAHRSYTTPAGKALLTEWLESASAEDRSAFDLAVHQDLLTDQDGGPDTTAQTRLMRKLRGFGSA